MSVVATDSVYQKACVVCCKAEELIKVTGITEW